MADDNDDLPVWSDDVDPKALLEQFEERLNVIGAEWKKSMLQAIVASGRRTRETIEQQVNAHADKLRAEYQRDLALVEKSMMDLLPKIQGMTAATVQAVTQMSTALAGMAKRVEVLETKASNQP
jgi:hypothetical protein